VYGRFILGSVEPASGGGAEDAVVLEAALPTARGVRHITVTVRYAAVRALRQYLAPPNDGEAAWPTGVLFGTAAGDAIVIEGAGTGAGSPIGIFRAQPGGWASLTEADRKKLKSTGTERGLLLVVRTLSMRPWSATLFTADAGADVDPHVIEFPLDEYVLRQGWLLDAPALPPPALRAPVSRRAWRRDLWVAGAAVLLGGAAAVSWQVQRAAPGKRGAAEAPAVERVERRLGLQAVRNGDDFEISWNRLSSIVQRATMGTLTIRNGPMMRVVAMRPEELRVNRILFHPLVGSDVELQLEVVDPHGVAQTDTLDLLGPAVGRALLVPEAEAPKPSPLADARQGTATRRANIAGADRRTGAAHPEARRIQPVRAELPANRGPLATLRVEPEITPKVRAEMRQAKGAVTVSVQVSINADGNVDGAMVLSSTGEPSPSGPYIRLASLNAARQWKFRPATAGGSRVPSKSKLVFDF
jgi:hypothetical protein